MLICCLCECVWLFVSRAQTSSGEQECEQVNTLLVGLQHHMEVGRPPVVVDTRYRMTQHDDGVGVGDKHLLRDCSQQQRG